MSKILTVHFSEFGMPVTGLAPTITVYDALVGAVSIVGVATEIAGGWYKYVFTNYNPYSSYVFTFDGGSILSDYDRYKHGGNDSYEEDIASSVWDESIINHTTNGTTGLALNQIKADTATMVVTEASINSMVNVILQYDRGRTKIDVPNATMTVYGVDKVTPIQVYNLLDVNGNPSVAEVCERVPTL
jgi:hypothetical protein